MGIKYWSLYQDRIYNDNLLFIEQYEVSSELYNYYYIFTLKLWNSFLVLERSMYC